MKLKHVHSVTDLGNWFRSKGLTPGENRSFGTVYPVHVGAGSNWASYHYRYQTYAQLGPKTLVRGLQTPQGNLAIDLNDTGVSDDSFHKLVRGHWRLWKPQSETEALAYIYHRVHAAAEKHHWPMAELFFNGYGYMDDYGFRVNHAVEHHEDHLHVGFNRHDW